MHTLKQDEFYLTISDKEDTVIVQLFSKDQLTQAQHSFAISDPGNIFKLIDNNWQLLDTISLPKQWEYSDFLQKAAEDTTLIITLYPVKIQDTEKRIDLNVITKTLLRGIVNDMLHNKSTTWWPSNATLDVKDDKVYIHVDGSVTPLDIILDSTWRQQIKNKTQPIKLQTPEQELVVATKPLYSPSPKSSPKLPNELTQEVQNALDQLPPFKLSLTVNELVDLYALLAATKKQIIQIKAGNDMSETDKQQIVNTNKDVISNTLADNMEELDIYERLINFFDDLAINKEYIGIQSEELTRLFDIGDQIEYNKLLKAWKSNQRNDYLIPWIKDEYRTLQEITRDLDIKYNFDQVMDEAIQLEETEEIVESFLSE